MQRIYQNEKVLMREVGLLRTVELKTVKEEVITFEGTQKQIEIETNRLFHQPNVIAVHGIYK